MKRLLAIFALIAVLCTFCTVGVFADEAEISEEASAADAVEEVIAEEAVIQDASPVEAEEVPLAVEEAPALDGGAVIDWSDHEYEKDSDGNPVMYKDMMGTAGFVPATCTEEGFYYVRCPECPTNNGKEAYHYVSIAADGHVWASDVYPDVATIYELAVLYFGETGTEADLPTCTGSGTVQDYCVNCLNRYLDKNDKGITSLDQVARGDYISVDPLGHEYTVPVIKKAATCVADGVMNLTCERCGEVQKDKGQAVAYVIPQFKTLKTNELVLEDGTKVSVIVLAEDLKKDPTVKFWTETKVDGKTVRTINDDYLMDAFEDGHNWSQWKVEKAATCAKDGSQSRTCSLCSSKEYKVIPATGKHDYKLKDIVMTSCTELVKVYQCSVCKETYKETMAVEAHNYETEVDENGDIVYYDAEVDSKGKITGYTESELTGPSCTDAVYVHYVCKICGVDKYAEIPALGHDWGEWEKVEDFTGKDGSPWTTWMHECKRCDLEEEVTVEGTAAPGAEPVDPVNPPKPDDKPDEKPEPAAAPTVKIAEDGATAKVEGSLDGVYARVALTIFNEANEQSGLIVRQATINADGTIIIDGVDVPGLKVTGVCVALVDSLGGITAPDINPIAFDFVSA